MDERPGEQVFFHGHPSWRSMLAFYLKGFAVTIAVGALVGVISAIANGGVKALWVAPAVAITLVLVLLIGFVRQIRTTYTITDQRLTIHSGLLSKDMHETRLERVQNVNSSQSILERMLKIGTVDFDTAGTAEFDFAFRGVAHPKEIVLTVDRALHDLQRTSPSGGV